MPKDEYRQKKQNNMWDFFKTKSKEELEQEGLVAEKRVAKLKIELKSIQEKCTKLKDLEYKRVSDEEKKNNSICPKCKSTNVNDRIKRQQGEINGKFSGEGWSALTFGSSHSSGSIKGSMDTNEVNKCNDCQHEWKKYKGTYIYSWGDDVIKKQLDWLRGALRLFYDAKYCKFDPMDLDEKYNSLEEKKSVLLKFANDSFYLRWVKDFWTGVSIDALEELVKKYVTTSIYSNWKTYYNEELLLSWGFIKS